MKLHAFDIPDAPAALPAWLEQHLVGVHLGELVAELTAVHGSSAGTETIDQVLGTLRTEVLANGLGALPRDRLRALLRQPALLLALQELVLAAGGAHWQRLADSGSAAAASRQLRSKALTSHGPIESEKRLRRAVWYQHPLIVSLTTAALLLICFFLFNQQKPKTPPPWGWNRPGALAASATRSEYLLGLADAAEEWFKVQPADTPALAKRISQFRGGCSTLILSDHPPLDAADKQWLVDKCRAWSAKIDGHLTALEAGDLAPEVRAAMDDTVRKLATAIRERAKSSSRAPTDAGRVSRPVR